MIKAYKYRLHPNKNFIWRFVDKKDHFVQYNTDKAEFLRTHQTMVKMMMITAQRVARMYKSQWTINVTLLTDTIDEPDGEGQPDNLPVESLEGGPVVP